MCNAIQNKHICDYRLILPYLDNEINDIISDRNSNKIGSSGSVQFVLKLSNAEHGDSTPSDFSLVVSAISSSWTEGIGLDMESYLDNIKDIERLQRKIIIGILKPYELSMLVSSYENIVELISAIKNNKKTQPKNDEST